MRGKTVAGLFLLFVFANCAITDAPPGGPEDTKPPKVVSIYPEQGSAGVPADAVIEITFDEKMSRGRIERLVTFYPPVTIKKASWKGNTVRLELEDPLNPDTTYVAELGSGFADAHGVRNQQTFRFAFATSAAIDSGIVTGRVFFRRQPTKKAVVRLFVLPKDSAFAPESGRQDRELETDEQGTYTFRYLPLERRFLLWAFQDADDDGNFNPETENAATYPDTLYLVAPITELGRNDIYIIDPKEPATIEGRIVNVTGLDSVPITLTLSELADTIPPTYVFRADLKGNYKFDKALQGEYILQGFLDLGADSLCGTYPCGPDSADTCQEPCVVYPDTLRLEPGGRKSLDDMTLEAVDRKGNAQ